ncbi:MAG: hypothetical protein IKM35_02865 [Bacteroidaceae bacterium]|nr:hypothetical protein [Bacteroidaceae bacterium]
MADNSKEIFASLKARFAQLATQNSQLQEECKSLQAQLLQLQEGIVARDERIEQLTGDLAQSEARYKNLQISQKAEMDTRQLQESRERFAKLVREIDKCISLLNE